MNGYVQRFVREGFKRENENEGGGQEEIEETQASENRTLPALLSSAPSIPPAAAESSILRVGLDELTAQVLENLVDVDLLSS